MTKTIFEKSGKRSEICRLWRLRRDLFPGKIARNHGIETIYSAQPLGGGRVLKWAPFVFIFIIFSRCHKSALLRRWLVTSRKSWTLIGRESALLRRWLIRAQYANYVSVSLSWRIDGEIRIMVLACQVGPFHLKLTQINSEMNCRGEKFNVCHEQRHVYLIFAFFLFDLFYVMHEKIQKILLYSLERLCY